MRPQNQRERFWLVVSIAFYAITIIGCLLFIAVLVYGGDWQYLPIPIIPLAVFGGFVWDYIRFGTWR